MAIFRQSSLPWCLYSRDDNPKTAFAGCRGYRRNDLVTAPCGASRRSGDKIHFGPPAFFREDFTSHSAFRQALLVQAVFVGVAFFALGSAAARWNLINGSYKHSLWVANPITVGVGFAAYKMAYHALSFPDGLAEYDSPAIFVLFTAASPVVFALCVYAGAHVRRSCTVAG